MSNNKWNFKKKTILQSEFPPLKFVLRLEIIADFLLIMAKLEKILGPNLIKEVRYESLAGTQAYTISSKNARFRYPFSISESLKMTHKFIVFQIYKRIGENVNITLNIKNDMEETLKIQFMTGSRNPRASQTLTAEQLDVQDNTWTNICFDLEFIVTKYFPGNFYKSLSSFEIMPTIHIRWVFAIPNQLLEENNGSDLPEITRFNGLNSKTILIGEKREVSTTPRERVSRIPIRRKTPTTGSGGRNMHIIHSASTPDEQSFSRQQKDGHSVTTYKQKKKPIESNSKTAAPKPKIVDEFDISSDEESSGDDDDAFSTTPSKPTSFSQPNDLDSSEEELELIYIDALQCYYCPSNQQYYQVDESKA